MRLAALGVILLVVDVVISTRRNATGLEVGLYNFITLVVSIGVSYRVGNQSAKAGAEDVVRPHGTKAVRRLRNLAGGLQDLGASVQQFRRQAKLERDPRGFARFFEMMCDSLDLQVRTQIRTVADAMEDWRDVVPDEVRRIEQAAPPRPPSEWTEAGSDDGSPDWVFDDESVRETDDEQEDRPE
jgi:hypothetical protein